MTAGNYNITAEQGASFRRVLTWNDAANEPINLTGYTARMQIRSDYFTPDPATISLTTENGRITLGGALGTISLYISATDMAALVADAYVYDLELISGAEITRLVQGTFVINAEVTR
jgi:hypothetical protein